MILVLGALQAIGCNPEAAGDSTNMFIGIASRGIHLRIGHSLILLFVYNVVTALDVSSRRAL
jgi:hypothetical protein